jgi:hypothetical protein
MRLKQQSRQLGFLSGHWEIIANDVESWTDEGRERFPGKVVMSWRRQSGQA